MNKCPKCKSTRFMVREYMMTAEDYDGVSEFICLKCETRYGRWTGKELKDGELEKRFGG